MKRLLACVGLLSVLAMAHMASATVIYSDPLFQDGDFSCALPLDRVENWSAGHTLLILDHSVKGYAVIVRYVGEETTAVIPTQVTYSGEHKNGEFWAASGLYPVREIKAGAFLASPQLEAIVLPDGLDDYKTVDGVLFSADGGTLLAYPSAHGDSYTVPPGTTAIAYGAFDLANLTATTLTIPAHVRTIETNALRRGVQPATLTVRCVEGSAAHVRAMEAGCPVELMPGEWLDISVDGLVDSSDARVILQHEVGLLSLSDARASLGDVDKDGLVDSSDARMILQYEVGLLSRLGGAA